MNDLTESQTPEQEQRPVDLDSVIETSPLFNDAFMNALRIFDPFIVYEKDAPEEARLNLFPFYTHIQRTEIDAAIMERYRPSGRILPTQGPADYLETHEGSEGFLEDQLLIKHGIDDSISILKKRTGGSFTSPGQGQLGQLEHDTLLDLAYLETRLFYRITGDDLLRGNIPVCQGYSLRANQPEGSRFRSWIDLKKFTAFYVEILADDSIVDPVMEIIKKSAEGNRGHENFVKRWREQELI